VERGLGVREMIKIGNIEVSRIGLGTNRLTDTPENRDMLNHAIKIGINFIDTANIYQSGKSETTIGNTLSPFPENILVASKGGMVPGSPANNDPEHLRQQLELSLNRLKTKCITLYQLHRVNPDTPVEDTMRFLKDLQQEGKIKHIGLSEVNVEQIERARNVVEITSVQNHYNLRERKHEEVLIYCEKNNIVFIPFFPLDKSGPQNEALNKIANKFNASPQQVTLAWLLKRSPVMLPIPGTLNKEHLEQNINSLNIELDDKDFQSLNK
jgi:pyridoxine 4-dehydrogenase